MSAWNAGDLGSIPGLGRYPREENGYSLQYSGLETSMDCIVHRVAKSQTQLKQLSSSRYADDTTLMAEKKEEIKNLLMKVKEKSETNWLKTQHLKN